MSEVAGLIKGLHHITLVTSNEEINRRFYTEILGLRRVKLTVNQDDFYQRHLFYADEKGTTGSAITFFEWPHLSRGIIGLNTPHHLAYTVTRIDALPKWKSWLMKNRVPISGPYVRDGRVSIYLRDPDGVILEIATQTTERVSQGYLEELIKELPSAKRIGQDMRLTVFNHATPISSEMKVTSKFFENLLGLTLTYTMKNPDDPNALLLGIGNAERSDFLRYLCYENANDGSTGIGNIHHIAMAVDDEDGQRIIMRRLNAAGIRHSGVIDRLWFKSLYFRDPDANLLEIATKGPGYIADEPIEQLGSRLVLPPWLEKYRSEIETRLAETDRQNPIRWPPSYEAAPSPPESLREVTRLGARS